MWCKDLCNCTYSWEFIIPQLGYTKLYKILDTPMCDRCSRDHKDLIHLFWWCPKLHFYWVGGNEYTECRVPNFCPAWPQILPIGYIRCLLLEKWWQELFSKPGELYCGIGKPLILPRTRSGCSACEKLSDWRNTYISIGDAPVNLKIFGVHCWIPRVWARLTLSWIGFWVVRVCSPVHAS